MREIQLAIELNKIAELRNREQKLPIITQRELIFYGNACGIPKLETILNLATVLHECGQIVYLR